MAPSGSLGFFLTLCSHFCLSQKERDLELAARIGQSLLKKNKTLTERNELLEEQVEHIREEVRADAKAVPQVWSEAVTSQGPPRQVPPPRARPSPVPKWPPRHRIPPFGSSFCSLCLLRRVWTRSPRSLFFQETHSVLSHGRPGTSHSPCPAGVQIVT